MHRFSANVSLVLALAASTCTTVAVSAATTTEFASSVASYSGPNSAGATVLNPNGSIGHFATSEGGYAIDPFFPPYPQTASGSYPAVLTTVKAGGALTLQFAAPVILSTGAYLGVYSSVGLINANGTPGGQPQAPSTGPITLSTPSEAIVSVSADGTHFVSLNGGAPITFDNPTNAFTTVDDTVVTSGSYTFVSPQPAASGTTPQYAAATPFSGNINDFAGQTESQILNLLNGTAGGTWIHLSGSSTLGLNSIDYVRFTVPSGESAYINAAALYGDPSTPTPEPSALLIGLVPLLGLLAMRRRRTA